MADLKPIGSEKLQGLEKINRILEIARYKENIPSNLNETSRVEFERVLADGNHYEIVKEKSGYVIKKRVDESLEYIEPMKNRKHYGSYSAALKRLNLIAGEVNRLTENEEEVSMYNLGEQKKFTLKTPKPAMPEPAAAPELPMPPAAPEADAMDDAQKLTGKLGQKIRMMNDSVGMTSEDVKYVINSLLSALDLSKLDEEDQEDIMAKFEEDQESSYDSDMDMGSMGDDDELDMDMEMDVEEPMDGEMEEGDVIGVYSNIDKQRDEMSEEDKVNSHVAKMMDEIFAESKIDKVLTSYFNISESEKKEKKQKLNESKKVAVSSIKRLSETIEQELAAEFIVRENSNYKLVGKTNKSNLVFEHNGEQIRVTPKGEVL